MHINMVLSVCFSCSMHFKRCAVGGKGLLSIVALVSSGMRHIVARTCLGVAHALTLINAFIATLYGAYLTALEAPSLTWFKCSHVNLI